MPRPEIGDSYGATVAEAASAPRGQRRSGVDEPVKRACVIDAGTLVGRDVNRLFVGFASREFGEDAFQVERLDQLPNHHLEEVHT